MEDLTIKNKKQIIIKAIISLLTLLTLFLIITCINLNNSLKRNKGFKYTYKLNCIDTVKTKIKFDIWMDVISYEITIQNESHSFVTYVIAQEKFSEEFYTETNEFIYKNPYNHLIDYNIGKVSVHIKINAKNIGETIILFEKSFDCYTKNSNETIKFYTTEHCKEEYVFLLNKLKNNNNYEAKVNLEITTKYKSE